MAVFTLGKKGRGHIGWAPFNQRSVWGSTEARPEFGDWLLDFHPDHPGRVDVYRLGEEVRTALYPDLWAFRAYFWGLLRTGNQAVSVASLEHAEEQATTREPSPPEER